MQKRFTRYVMKTNIRDCGKFLGCHSVYESDQSIFCGILSVLRNAHQFVTLEYPTLFLTSKPILSIELFVTLGSLANLEIFTLLMGLKNPHLVS